MKSTGVCNESYPSETAKIRPKIQKYLNGKIIDLGCGQDLVAPGAYGVDARKFPHTSLVIKSLYGLPQLLPQLAASFDVVYSSHTLEHLPNDAQAIHEWTHFLKVGGVLILYLPDDRWYDNNSNPEHLQRYTYPVFMTNFITKFPHLQVVESGEDFGHDRYSFYVVCKKTF